MVGVESLLVIGINGGEIRCRRPDKVVTYTVLWVLHIAFEQKLVAFLIVSQATTFIVFRYVGVVQRRFRKIRSGNLSTDIDNIS